MALQNNYILANFEHTTRKFLFLTRHTFPDTDGQNKKSHFKYKTHRHTQLRQLFFSFLCQCVLCVFANVRNLPN